MADRFGCVQRRSVQQIEKLAANIREELGVGPSDRVAMRPILDHYLDDIVPDAYLAIEFDGQMNGAEGRTDWLEPVITLSASTYKKLRIGDPRARSTAAHELGHLLMHTRQPVFHYRTRSKDRCVDPEWQADTFAAAFLMPRHAFLKMKTVKQAMKAFGISRGAALVRARNLNMRIVDDLARGSSAKKKGHDVNRAP
jgi:hypothetical protein